MLLMTVTNKIASSVVLPAKVIGACLISFCIYVGLRYTFNGMGEKDLLKSGAGIILLLFPAFFIHHLLLLKFLKVLEDRLYVKDIFNSEEITLNRITSFKRLNFFTYEILIRDGKKFNTFFFVLNSEEVARIRNRLGLFA
jgi:hypothetical protein